MPEADPLQACLDELDGVHDFARFLDDGRICLSNNAAERALRGRVGGVVTEPLPSQTRASGITALGSSHARFAQAA